MVFFTGFKCMGLRPEGYGTFKCKDCRASFNSERARATHFLRKHEKFECRRYFSNCGYTNPSIRREFRDLRIKYIALVPYLFCILFTLQLSWGTSMWPITLHWNNCRGAYEKVNRSRSTGSTVVRDYEPINQFIEKNICLALYCKLKNV
jgi:hypothetical protein